MDSKKFGLLILVGFNFFVKINAQGPPPPAMPSESNTVLIDKIIEVTNHKKFFTDYCTKKVKEYAGKSNWEEAKIKKILASLDFHDYNFSIYNSYAFYSETQLKNLLTILTDLAKTKNSSQFILTNDMMQSNLDLYIENLLEGKYLR